MNETESKMNLNVDDRDQCPKQEKRLQFGRGKLTWKVDQHLKNVIFRDEMTIVIKPGGKK